MANSLHFKARDLKGIRWVHQPLENLQNLQLGKFDFIECREVNSSSKISYNIFIILCF